MGFLGGSAALTAIPKGLAAIALDRQAMAANNAPDDGYNQIYEKDGGYYTREANPDYITYEPRNFNSGGLFNKVLRNAFGAHVAKQNEGVDPYIYTAIDNPYSTSGRGGGRNRARSR